MNDNTKPIIGFIGLGLMGAAMASNLQSAGYHLVVHDVRRAATDQHTRAGATWADTPQQVARESDVVFTCLPEIPIIEAVGLGPEGIISGIKRGQAWFDLSTSAPDLVARLHEAFARKGAHMLDSPVSGGSTGAKRGRLAIWVGGDKGSYERYEPVLRVIGDQPVHVGKVGTGTITKLVNNCMAQATQAAIAEIFMLGVKAGADPLPLWEALRQGAAGRRRTLDGLIDQFMPGQYDEPHSALRIVHKDMVGATDLARSLNVPLRFAALTLADIQEAMQRGWSERDSRSVMLLPQERVGVMVKEDPAAIEAVLQRDPCAPSDSKRGIGT